jgi:hypothetical protein
MSERIAGDAIWAYWLLAATVEEDVREQAQVLVVDAMHEIRPKTGKLNAIRAGVAAAAKKAKRPGPEGEAAWTDFVEGLDEDFPKLSQAWTQKIEDTAAAEHEAEQKEIAVQQQARGPMQHGGPSGRILAHKLPEFRKTESTMGAWLGTAKRKLDGAGFSLDSMDGFSLLTAALGDAADLFWVLFGAAKNDRNQLERVLNEVVAVVDAGERMRCLKAFKKLQQGSHSLSWLHGKFSKIVEVLDKYTSEPMTEADRLMWFSASMREDLLQKAWRDDIKTVIDLVKTVAMRGLEKEQASGARALLYHEDEEEVTREKQQELMAVARKQRRPTGVCFSFRDTGKCRFGSGCRFEHQGQGKGKGKTNECHNFINQGTCRFGDRCKFAHTVSRTQARNVSFAEDEDGGEFVESFAIARTEELMQVAVVGSTGTLMDSGAGGHVTNSKTGLINLRPDSKVYSLADVGTPGAKKHRSSVAGDKMFRSPDGRPGFKLTDVSVVESLGREIMSVSHACDQGNVVLFTRDGAHIVKERDAAEIMKVARKQAVATGRRNGNLYELNEPRNKPARGRGMD